VLEWLLSYSAHIARQFPLSRSLVTHPLRVNLA
jgi:hypothetical protein